MSECDVKRGQEFYSMWLLGGSGGTLPQENLAFLMVQDCFWCILSMLVLIVSSMCKSKGGGQKSLKEGRVPPPPPLNEALSTDRLLMTNLI